MSSLEGLYTTTQNKVTNIEDSINLEENKGADVKEEINEENLFSGVGIAYMEDYEEVVEESNHANIDRESAHSVAEPIPPKITSSIKKEDSLKAMFDRNLEIKKDLEHVNDSVLEELSKFYTPEDVPEESLEKICPKKESNLYETSVISDKGKKYYEELIDNYFQVDKDRASFSTEELNLHNRLTSIKDVDRVFDNYILVQAPTGDMVVANDWTTGSDIVNTFMEEAKEKVRCGKRIEIQLVEEYTFTNRHSETLTRERFRATMREIREFVSLTKMRARITKDAVLVIFE
jgi:hypothetical protein